MSTSSARSARARRAARLGRRRRRPADRRHGRPGAGATSTPRWARSCEPLALRSRHRAPRRQAPDATALEFSTTDLQFDTADGLRWPGGNLWFQHTPAEGRARRARRAARRPARPGRAGQIANRLPLGDATHTRARPRYAPHGLVERIDASWQGPLGRARSATRRAAGSAASAWPRSRATHARRAPATARADAGRRPGLRGATRRLRRHPGRRQRARSPSRKGALDLPGVFEDPLIPIDAAVGRSCSGRSTASKIQLQRRQPALRQRRCRRARRRPAGAPATRPPRARDALSRRARPAGQAHPRRRHARVPLPAAAHPEGHARLRARRGHQGHAPARSTSRSRATCTTCPSRTRRQGEFRITAQVADVHLRLRAAQRRRAADAAWPALTRPVRRAGVRARRHAGAQRARAASPARPASRWSRPRRRSPTWRTTRRCSRSMPRPRARSASCCASARRSPARPAPTLAQARATGNADYRLQLELPLSRHGQGQGAGQRHARRQRAADHARGAAAARRRAAR